MRTFLLKGQLDPIFGTWADIFRRTEAGKRWLFQKWNKMFEKSCDFVRKTTDFFLLKPTLFGSIYYFDFISWSYVCFHCTIRRPSWHKALAAGQEFTNQGEAWASHLSLITDSGVVNFPKGTNNSTKKKSNKEREHGRFNYLPQWPPAKVVEVFERLFVTI